MRKRLRRLVWSMLWEVGDYCLWKAKQIEPDEGKGTTVKLREPIRIPVTATTSNGSTWTIRRSTWPVSG